MSILTGVAAMFYRHNFQRLRSEGYYDNDTGHYVRLLPQTSWHKGNFMPAGQKQIERLPEGTRSDGALTLYTDAELRTGEAPNQTADRVMFSGVEYAVSATSDWASHNWYVMTKVGQ